MLILTRRLDETVMMADHVTLTVLGVNGNQVRVAIAPKSVVVHREEIYERIKRGRVVAESSSDEPPNHQ